MPRIIPTIGRLLPRFMGGSTLFNGTTSVVTVTSPVDLPTDAFSVSFWYKTNAIFASNQGWFSRTGSILISRQGTNDVQIYAYLDAPSDFATPRRLRFRSFSHPKADNRWHFRTYTFYVVGGYAKCDEYEDAVKIGSTHTVDYTGDTNSPTGSLTMGKGFASFAGLMSDIRFHSTALSVSKIQSLYFSGADSLYEISKYLLDDQPSSYVDSIGGANGTGTATTYSADVPVQQRRLVDEEAKASLLFDGVNDYVGISGLSIVGTKVSASFRIKRVGSGSGGVPRVFTFGKGTGAKTFEIGIGNVGAGGIPAGNFGIGSWVNSGFNVSNSEWLWGTFIFDGLISYLYVNAKLVHKYTHGAGIDGLNGELFLGNSAAGSGDASNFLMKNFIIHSTVLTKQEIIDLHFSNVIPNRELKGNWKMDEGAGTTVFDTSGNGKNGTTSGATWSSDVPSKKRKLIGGNLVNNGDFAYQPPFVANQTTSARWLDGTAAGSTSKLPINVHASFGGAAGDKYARLTERNGIKCLLIHTNAGAFAEIRIGSTIYYGVRSSQDFDVKPNTQYKLSGYIETENVSGDSADGGYVHVLFSKGDGTSSEAKSSSKFKVNSPRTYFETIFTTNSTSRCGHIECRVYGHTGAATLAGDFYFSDIQLIEVGAARLPVT